jgi:hypothetical protein
MKSTKDGGYVVTGLTTSFGAGRADAWIVKLDKTGKEEWAYAYGGDGWDEPHDIREIPAGGYILTGWTRSFGANNEDVWVLKLDKQGNFVWSRNYGTENYEQGLAIEVAQDGGYIVAGKTEDSGKRNRSGLILKIDENGDQTWEKTPGSDLKDWFLSITRTPQNRYILAGCKGFTATQYQAAWGDAWVYCINTQGLELWDKNTGGKKNWEKAESVQQTADGNYIVAGYKWINNQESGNAYVLKIQYTGVVVWDKSFGGEGEDSAVSICQASDGGYIVAGYSESFGAEGGWIFKIDEDGNSGAGDK